MKLWIDWLIIWQQITIDESKYLINNKFKVNKKVLDEFLNDFSYDLVCSPQNVEEKLFEIRDKDDYIILHTAIVEDVDIFITGDKDFNDVKINKPKIMSVNEFMKKYYK